MADQTCVQHTSCASNACSPDGHNPDGPAKPGSHTDLCQPARLKHGRHSYQVAARVDEVRQRLIVEEGKMSILAPQRSSQSCELRLHTSRPKLGISSHIPRPWRDSPRSILQWQGLSAHSLLWKALARRKGRPAWILGSGADPSSTNCPPRSSVRQAACLIRCRPADRH